MSTPNPREQWAERVADILGLTDEERHLGHRRAFVLYLLSPGEYDPEGRYLGGRLGDARLCFKRGKFEVDLGESEIDEALIKQVEAELNRIV